MSKGDGKVCPPPEPPTKKKSPATDETKSLPKSKQPAPQKPKIHPTPQELSSKKKQIKEILSKPNFGQLKGGVPGLFKGGVSGLFKGGVSGLLKGDVPGLFKGGVPGMGDTAKSDSRPMKYPYTFSAKIAQFPYKYHLDNHWLFKYYLIAVIVTIPVFYKMGKLSYSPENVKEWDERRKELFSPGGSHHL